MWRIELDGPTDAAGFRRAVKALVAAGIAPESVAFGTAGAPGELFGTQPFDVPADPAPLALPAGFAALCEQVLLHEDGSRFERLYTLAWRIAHDRAVWADTLDPQRRTLDRMAHAVRREIHKMHAFVRFRPVPGGSADEPVCHVAWFEPAHHVVAAAAPFFARRFTHQHWAILTPRGSVHWNGERLEHAGPARAEDAPPADAGEALWLAYYRSIFNPARLKVAMMKREMPVRFWKQLPETHQVSTLVAQAAQRTHTMFAAEPQPRERRRGQPAGCGAPADVPALSGLAALAAQAARCDACPIGAQATQLVWGEGATDAALMLVGEQPGDREDLEGRPFVGPAGQLLRQAIGRLGWPAERLYLTNAVKHFKFVPRGKRRLHKTAAQREAAACAHWLEAEIATVRPRALVALGVTAARSLLGQPIEMQHAAGRWFKRSGDGLSVLVVPHPASLLRADGGLHPGALAQWQLMLAQASPVLAPVEAGIGATG
jgi:DNA polymerase